MITATPPKYLAAELTQPKFSTVTVNFKLSGNRQPESEKGREKGISGGRWPLSPYPAAICSSVLYSGLLRPIRKPRILYYAAGSCPERQAINQGEASPATENDTWGGHKINMHILRRRATRFLF